jgi:C4-dicarboxylate-specific signal transduction histidine kinase
VAVTLAAYNSTCAFSDGLHLRFVLTEKTRQLAATNHRLETEITQHVAEEQLRQTQKDEAISQLTG